MAISKTNQTLWSSVKAVEDTSLMGIMMLSLFEVSLAPDHFFSFRSRVDRLATFLQQGACFSICLGFKHEADNGAQSLTCCSVKSKESWIKHITGAATLIDLRGESQFKSERGRSIFLYVRSNIVSPPIKWPCCQRFSAERAIDIRLPPTRGSSPRPPLQMEQESQNR
jgi:hypothetical protein